jgi:cell division protein FtsL
MIKNSRMVSWLISMGLFAVAAFGLYMVKYTVQDMQREVAQLETEWRQEQESLHLLSAEWAYLNRPERLRQLAERHLDVVALDTRNIIQIQALPPRIDLPPQEQQEKTFPSASERSPFFQPVGGH